MRLAPLSLSLLCLQGGAAAAQGNPLVELALSSDTVLVGEAVDVEVTLLVPTWFSQPPEFPALEIANAVTRRPPNSSYPTSRRVGGDTWSGIVRSYRIFPLTGARFELAGQAVTVRYANPGNEPATAELQLPDIRFTATVPAGAEALAPYIAGTALTFTRELETVPQALTAGDAVVVVYTAQLTGLPALFLPTLAPPVEQEGLAAYADAPTVEEGPPARRKERVTVVFEHGGEFTLPGAELRWWNTASSRIETVSVAPMTLSVSGPPVTQTELMTKQTSRRLSVVVAVAGALLFALTLWRGGPALRKRWETHRRRLQASEPAKFAPVTQALKAGNLRAGYAAIVAWLPRLDADLDIRQFARQHGDAALVAQVEALLAALYAPGEHRAVDGGQLATLLGDARRRCLAVKTRVQGFSLPPMNS